MHFSVCLSYFLSICPPWDPGRTTYGTTGQSTYGIGIWYWAPLGEPWLYMLTQPRTMFVFLHILRSVSHPWWGGGSVGNFHLGGLWGKCLPRKHGHQGSALFPFILQWIRYIWASSENWALRLASVTLDERGPWGYDFPAADGRFQQVYYNCTDTPYT